MPLNTPADAQRLNGGRWKLVGELTVPVFRCAAQNIRSVGLQ
jgi:hypothetical protein